MGLYFPTTEDTEITEFIKKFFSVFSVSSVLKHDGEPNNVDTLTEYRKIASLKRWAVCS